jgi:hypothetical protein
MAEFDVDEGPRREHHCARGRKNGQAPGIGEIERVDTMETYVDLA